jgi:nitrogen fixation NifU-like protein
MYSDKVMEHFRKPHNAGIMDNPDGVAEIGNPACGDVMKIFIKVDEKHILQDIKFQTFGCAAAIACSSMVTDLAKGKHIDDAEKITKMDVADALEGLPPQKMHCSNLGADALRLAIQNYRKAHNLPYKNEYDEIAHKEEHPEEDSNEIHVDLTLDLHGKQCPMTFVHTKVGLESLQANQVLKVILDFVPAFTNVPESVKKQSLGIIIAEKEENGTKTLWIKRS